MDGGLARRRLGILLDRAAGQRYRGWDPYDGLTTDLAAKAPHWVKVLMLQSGPYSPINLRPALRIEPTRSNKTLALFCQANALAARLGLEGNRQQEAVALAQELWDRRQLVAGSPGWNAFSFRYQMWSHELRPDLVDIMGTTIAAKAFLAVGRLTGSQENVDRAAMAIETIWRSFVAEHQGRWFVRYTPEDNSKIVYNVTALFLEVVGELEALKPGSASPRTGALVEFLSSTQKPNGEWDYAYYLRTGRRYRQTDYHQGFLLDGLRSIRPWAGRNLAPEVVQRLDAVIGRAHDFYRRRQFRPSGRPLYRIPLGFPACSHNAAQGIISFASDPKAQPLATAVLRYANRWLWSERLQGYCQRWPGWQMQIDYPRWVQGWMAIALGRAIEAGLAEGPHRG